MNQTLAIIKPDAVKAGYIGKILARVEEEGFQIVGLRMLEFSSLQAQEFYAVHKERPFYNSLVDFMVSGPVVVAALKATGAVKKWRDLIGATDPSQAEENTIRKLYAQSKECNAVHGSDSDENASQEINFFFGKT